MRSPGPDVLGARAARLALALFMAWSLVASALARAQQQPPGCVSTWLPTFGVEQGLPGTVRALLSVDAGSVIAPGLYAAWDNGPGARISRWDGARWSVVAATPSGLVRTLRLFDDGSGPALYAGGTFQSIDGVAASRVARWDGGSWSALGAGVTNEVSALAVFDDGTGPRLYAGGAFTSAGGAPASRIASWDGAGWSALGGGVDAFVNALEVFDDGSGAALYAGGFFTLAGGSAAQRIARWDGTAWSALGSGANLPVRELAVHDDGLGGGPALYAGGDFTVAGGSAANHVARWDGTSWSALSGGVDHSVFALQTFSAQGARAVLYVGGLFAQAGGAAASRIASWDGASWSTVGGGVNTTVFALTVHDDGTSAGPVLWAAGAFTVAGILPANRIARWEGEIWSTLGSQVNDLVFDLAVFDDGGGPALYAGGEFQVAGGRLARHVARWNGSSWAPLGRGLDGRVIALAVFDDGGGPALYAGGEFTTAGTVAANRIAKWDGTSWSALGSGVDGSFRPAVFALEVYDDGLGGGPALYAAGDFTSAGEIGVSHVARWDGTSWSRPGNESFSPPNALEVFDERHGGGPVLFVGGRNFLRRWDGTLWTSVPISSAGTFSVFALLAGGTGAERALYVGGGFSLSTAGGQAWNVAKWDGSAWSALGPGIGPTLIHSFALFDEGGGPRLFAGGHFTFADGFDANNVARWDGVRWSPLESGVSATVQALAVHNDGGGPALWLGGNFASSPAGDRYLAKWGCRGAASGSAFCFGDGTGAACPCGNSGASGHGCENGFGTGGVELSAWGAPAMGDVVLTGTGFPFFSSPAAVLLRSTTPAAVPSPFGDGLSCLEGSIARVSSSVAFGGQSSHLVTHLAGAGTYHYQLWYRSAGAVCTRALNFSNGYTIVWP